MYVISFSESRAYGFKGNFLNVDFKGIFSSFSFKFYLFFQGWGINILGTASCTATFQRSFIYYKMYIVAVFMHSDHPLQSFSF